MRRALITGIGGQDGSYLAELLLNADYEVVGLVRPGAARYENLAGIEGRIELYEADLLNPTSLAQALRAARPAEVRFASSIPTSASTRPRRPRSSAIQPMFRKPKTRRSLR